jgi:phenylacetic acid degradation operon negative regulatory protein
MQPTPRSLILSLMLGARVRADSTLGVHELLAACAVFGLPENSVRVALARAVAANLLVTPRRGQYALGPMARPLADEVHRWRSVASQLVDWNGDWVAVHVGASGRSDRPALRARERAFGLMGLAEFERGLHLRPNNLKGGASGVRERLRTLLPDGTAIGTVFLLRDLSDEDVARARALWDGAALNAGYRDTTRQLSSWLERSGSLPPNRAAREAFSIGDAAIRRLVFDPLLPSPLVDARARARFIETVSRFDDAGRVIWRQFFQAARATRSRRVGSTPTTQSFEANTA